MKVVVLQWLIVVLPAQFISVNGCAQELISRKVEDLTDLQFNEERLVLVFLTAEWCTYCERIKETSYKQKEITSVLNEDFYYVEFDIEQKNTITIGEQEFVFVPSGVDTGIHQFAEAIGTVDGVVSTPTFVVLNARWEIVYQYNGFMNQLEIREFLNELLTSYDQ